MKKTAAAVAIAALAVPAAAQADKPQTPGAKGQTQSAEAKAKQKKAKKAKGVGFTLGGLVVDPTKVTFDVNTTSLAAAPAIDLTSANSHALKALGLQKAALEGTTVTELAKLPVDDTFTVKLEGLTDAAALQAGDRVKVIGKVVRTVKKGKSDKATKFTYGAIDIKKVVITRGETPQS